MSDNVLIDGACMTFPIVVLVGGLSVRRGVVVNEGLDTVDVEVNTGDLSSELETR